ncbi:6-carboxytetrahydropterin synthase QueD [Bacillus sp. JCM 19041]|uniref:6-carboxytetrahydropterin synthase QueD n=1 Tax=Bacillus sp. JCM 19041 TaxID=1460637 RepID=UPI0006D196B3
MLQQIYPTPDHDFQYELNKDMQVAAAHYIDNPRAGKCQQVHGHTYFINLTIGGDQLDDLGFLVDFKALKQTVHDRFDHTLINEDKLFFTSPPSTEKMAETIYDLVEKKLQELENRPTCLQVFVRETPTSYVTFRPKRQAYE